MALEPTNSDNCRDLWRKIAENVYEYALSRSASGINPPSWNDNIPDLEKKVSYATAKMVDIHP